MKVGVLALQGGFAEHLTKLEELGTCRYPIRKPNELDGMDALIIPGGESTSVSRLITLNGFSESITSMARSGRPIWGTCAGMILMARSANGVIPKSLGLVDIEVKRNAFGSQIDSFEMPIPIQLLGDIPFNAVFIRAPMVTNVGPKVKVLASLPSLGIVAIQQGNLLGTAFHPELTRDNRFHQYFLSLMPIANRSVAQRVQL